MNPTVLDTLELSYNQSQSVVNGTLVDLESEKYLIQVEGVWKDNSSATSTANNTSAANNNIMNRKPGMQKLLTKKFRMPSKIIPLHPEERRKRQWMDQQGGSGNGGFGKRRSRPLQPGELERQYYGDSCNAAAGGGYFDDGNQRGWHNENNDDRGGYCNDNHGGNNSNAHSMANGSNDNERRIVDQSYGNNTNSSNHSRAQYNDGSSQRPTQYNNEYGRNQPVQQSRHDFRRKNEPQNTAVNQVDGNNRGGGGNSFRSNNNRNRFRSSNGYDPNGFYAEEDDDEEDYEQQSGTVQDDRNGNNDGRTGVEQIGEFGANQSFERDYSGGNHNGPEDHNTRHELASCPGIHENTKHTSHIQSQNRQDTKNSTPKDDHDEQVTNHLLALLGAAPPSASSEIVPPPNPILQEDHEPNNDGNVNHNSGDNSFLASIRQVSANEDHQQQDHSVGDGPVGYDWAANSDYDDDDEEDDTYDQQDQDGNNENSFLNDLVGIGSKPPPDVPETTAVPKESITGFTLPSAGESSSSDDDSDDE